MTGCPLVTQRGIRDRHGHLPEGFHLAQFVQPRVALVICDCTIEDFHKALKTGCRIEQRFLQSVEALRLTPIALRLLLIRQAAQQATEMPATEVVS